MTIGCGRLGFDPVASVANDAASDAPSAPPAIAGELAAWIARSTANTCGATACADGDALVALADTTGNGHAMTQTAAAAQPTFVAACAGGEPCIRFAAGQWLHAPAPLPSVDDWTVVAMVRITDCPGAEPVMAYCPLIIDGSDNDIEGIYIYQDTKRLGIDALPVAPLQAYGASSLSTTAFSYVAISRGAANAYEIDVDGALDGSGTYPAPKTGDAFSHLARDADVSDGFIFVGDIAELHVYDHVLAPADRQAVEQYLRSTYGP